MTFRNHAARANRYILPEIASGYQLDPARGFFSAVMPLGADKTNVCINPVCGTGTTGYAVTGTGSLSRDTTIQKFGLASLKVVPDTATDSGVYFGVASALSLTAATQYFGSVWFKGQAGLKYAVRFATTGGVLVGQYADFTATGYWQRVSAVYLETASTTRRFYITKNGGANVAPFWVGALDIEQDQVTTHIDGDLVGFVRGRADYYWTGTPHASTSVRIGQSRSGGKVVRLADLGFRLLSVLGLGLAGVSNQFTPLAQGGAYYGGTVIADRQFSLIGQIDGDGLVGLDPKRQAFIDMVKPDVVTPDQPMILHYQPSDDCGNVLGPTQEIVCVSEGDPLAMKMDNLNSERLGLTFHLFLPFVAQEIGNAAAPLTYQTSLASVNNIMQRSAAGAWAKMDIGVNATVEAMVRMPNGDIIVAGDFTSAGGVANTGGIAKWSPSTQSWSALGTGVTSGTVLVNSLAVDANGILYAGGAFGGMGGVANTVRIAKWNGTAWSAMGTGASSNQVLALAVDNQGNVYAGGDFGAMGGVANTQRVAVWTGAAWGSLFATVPNGTVRAITRGAGNLIFVGGDFTTFGGVAAVGVAKFNSLAPVPTPLDTGIGGLTAVQALFTGPDGTLFVGGVFTSAGGVTVSNVASWNGVSFSALGDGVTGGAGVSVFGWDTLSNTLLVGGSFTAAGSITAPYGFARWNGSVWLLPDVDPPGTALFAIVSLPNGQEYLGFDGAGTAVVGGVTTITNTGSVAIGPVITLTGPGTVYGITNYTTGKVILFNLTLLAGETVVLDLSNPSGITFVSSFFGNILNKLLAGGQANAFKLAPGANSISLYIGGTVTAATAANIAWRITQHSIDGAIPNRLLP